MEALLPLIITFGLMWALLIRPQQRRVREHQQLVSMLSTGDEVITTGGIVGTIVSVVDEIVTLEVAPDTAIKVLRSAIQTRIASDSADVYEADDDRAADYGADNEGDDDHEADDAEADDRATLVELEEYDAILDTEPPAKPRPAAVDDITLTSLPTTAPPLPTTPPPAEPSTGEKA